MITWLIRWWRRLWARPATPVATALMSLDQVREAIRSAMDALTVRGAHRRPLRRAGPKRVDPEDWWERRKARWRMARDSRRGNRA